MGKIVVFTEKFFIASVFARITCFFVAFTIFMLSAKSQSRIDSLLGKLDPKKFAVSIGKKSEKLEDILVTKSMKVLYKLQSREEKIYSKLLFTKDSIQAKISLTDIKAKYKTLRDKFKKPFVSENCSHYIPHLDSLTTALKFLNQNGIAGDIKNVLNSTKSLQSKFQQTEEIKNFINERKEQLRQQMEKLGMVKQLKQINKQVYYYAALIKECREIIKDPKKIEKKALEILAKSKNFQDFMKKNSMLASLFRIPGEENDPSYRASLAGLQTRVQVNALIQQQISSGGPNAQQQFQQNMISAQGQLNELKSKIGQLGGGSSDDIMPEGFKPNSEKTKSLFKRLEYSANIQTQKATGYFVTSSDIGLSVGFKINDRSIIGTGISYKLGLGRGWQHIKLSSEGVGLRSYVDWKLKGSFWVSGGYEMNYRTAFSDFAQLKDLNAWQKSGLIGISKSIPVKSKFFKKSKIQLLWDFLSQQQIPKTQSIIFRIGYNFK